MKEETAKTKLCCVNGCGVVVEVSYKVNEQAFSKKERRCAGSACMGWRWLEWKLDKNQRVTDEGVSGYCGATK